MWRAWVTGSAFVLVSLAFAGGSFDTNPDLAQPELPKVADPEIAALLQQLQDKAFSVEQRVQRITARQAAEATARPTPSPTRKRKPTARPTLTPAPTATPTPGPTARLPRGYLQHLLQGGE